MSSHPHRYPYIHLWLWHAILSLYKNVGSFFKRTIYVSAQIKHVLFRQFCTLFCQFCRTKNSNNRNKNNNTKKTNNNNKNPVPFCLLMLPTNSLFLSYSLDSTTVIVFQLVSLTTNSINFGVCKIIHSDLSSVRPEMWAQYHCWERSTGFQWRLG